jgi:hypothetical protein
VNSTAIAASGLRKAYGDKTILDGIDLTVPADEVPLRSDALVYGVRSLPVTWKKV